MPKLYQPSNGSEGMEFMARYCDQCIHDAEYQKNLNPEDGCPQLAASMAFNPGEPEYPQEWIEDDDGYGFCTKFILKDSEDEDKYNARLRREALERQGQQTLFEIEVPE